MHCWGKAIALFIDTKNGRHQGALWIAAPASKVRETYFGGNELKEGSVAANF